MSVKVAPFNKVKEEFGWLSNMFSSPIVYNDHVWRTPEALFQAMRFPDCQIVRDEIRLAKSPMTAKMKAKKAGRTIGYSIQPMSEQDVINMRNVLILKVEQHPVFVDQLRNIPDALIVEDCTARSRGRHLFWGAALRDGEWIGQNQLGKLWMDIRSEHLHSCKTG